MTQNEIGCIFDRLKRGSKLLLAAGSVDASPASFVISWFGYGQFLLEDRGASRVAEEPTEVTRAYAIDDAALRLMLTSHELAPGRRIAVMGFVGAPPPE